MTGVLEQVTKRLSQEILSQMDREIYTRIMGYDPNDPQSLNKSLRMRVSELTTEIDNLKKLIE